MCEEQKSNQIHLSLESNNSVARSPIGHSGTFQMMFDKLESEITMIKIGDS